MEEVESHETGCVNELITDAMSLQSRRPVGDRAVVAVVSRTIAMATTCTSVSVTNRGSCLFGPSPRLAGLLVPVMRTAMQSK